MRPYGSGSIRTRKSKRTGKESFDVHVSQDGGRHSLGTYTSKEAADAALWAHHQANAAEGVRVPQDPGILTLRKLGALYLDTLSPKAQRTDRSRWKARVEETAEFIDWPVTQIDDADVRDWVDQMCTTLVATGKSAGKPAARTTIQNALNLLRGALKWAVIKRYAPRNPAKDVSISESTTSAPKSRKHAGHEYLYEDEVRKVLAGKLAKYQRSGWDPELPLSKRTMFILLAFTGARPIDLWTASWDRCDVSGATILYRSNKKERDYTVHLLPTAHQALREWWIASGRPKTGLLFPGPDGSAHTTGYDAGWADVRRRIHRSWTVASGEKRKSRAERVSVRRGVRARLGIERDLSIYALRHTCASHLLLGTELFTGGRRWSLEEIASHLGHTDLSTVRKYAISLGIAARRAVEESRVAIKANRDAGR